MKTKVIKVANKNFIRGTQESRRHICHHDYRKTVVFFVCLFLNRKECVMHYCKKCEMELIGEQESVRGICDFCLIKEIEERDSQEFADNDDLLEVSEEELLNRDIFNACYMGII